MPMNRVRPATAVLLALVVIGAACVADDPAGFDETREQRLEETPVGGEEEGLETEPDRPEADPDEEATGTDEETAAEDGDTIVELLAGREDLSTLRAAIEAAGLEETLATADSVTVFAPTDDAFDALPEGVLDALVQDPDALEQVLRYHVLPVAQTSGTVAAFSALATLHGAQLPVSVDEDDRVFVAQAEVIEADLEATNGVVHVIDAVLVPPEEDDEA